MKTHGTYYNDNEPISDGQLGIRVDYSAANLVGGMVRTRAWAVMGTDCEIIRVVDYGILTTNPASAANIDPDSN